MCSSVRHRREEGNELESNGAQVEVLRVSRRCSQWYLCASRWVSDVLSSRLRRDDQW